MAEMWFGAHPADPSRLKNGRTLEQAIREDPESMLGSNVLDSFGDRLPYLMKLLAAREPLSLQVHPMSERARICFAEQAAAGIPIDAAERSYFNQGDAVFVPATQGRLALTGRGRAALARPPAGTRDG